MICIHNIEQAQMALIDRLQDLPIPGEDKVAAVECLFQAIAAAKGVKPIRRTVAESLQRAQAVNDTFWDFPGFKAVALFVKNELD